MNANDQAIRDLIARVRSRYGDPGFDADAYELARAAETLMAERDQRARDFYASNRRIAYLEAEVERLRDRLNGVADAIEAQARIAREHGAKD